MIGVYQYGRNTNVGFFCGVEDEDFVPSTITELCNSATLICKEVPIEQIEFFYRQLHITLDEALDRNDQRAYGGLNESFEISKRTTIKDFNIISSPKIILSKKNPLNSNKH